MIRFPGSETSFRNQGFHGSGSVWEQDALLVPVYLVAVATATINTGSLQQEGTITWSMERYRRVFVVLHDGWFDYVFSLAGIHKLSVCCCCCCCCCLLTVP